MLLQLQCLFAFISLTVFCLCCDNDDLDIAIAPCGQPVGTFVGIPPEVPNYTISSFEALPGTDCAEISVAGRFCTQNSGFSLFLTVFPAVSDTVELVIRTNTSDTCQMVMEASVIQNLAPLQIGRDSTILLFPELDTSVTYIY